MAKSETIQSTPSPRPPRTTGSILKPVLLTSVVLLIIAQVVALSPSDLESQKSSTRAALDPSALIPNEDGTLATGIPKGKIPDYTVDQFNYVSTQGKEKLWNLVADQAFLYNEDDIVHSIKIVALLFDPEGKTTRITGKEAKYFSHQKDLEVFGDVNVDFPDGFQLKSQYLKYRPSTRRIEIPAKFLVHGAGTEKTGERTEFESMGFDFEMAQSRITLPSTVKLRFTRPAPQTPSTSGKTGEAQAAPEPTQIESDRCVIFRNKQLAKFTMDPLKEASKRFVHITQPTLFARGRRADLSYGSSSQLLQYLVAFEDVLIKEIGKDKAKESLRYGTGGRADFDTRRNVIILSEYPQVYQDRDTVTGDVIIVHRDTDVVEVEHSNAYSDGTDESP